MAWVYILKCSDGSYYTGSTLNLELRLWEHNKGDEGVGANYTRKRRPVKLVFAEEYERVEDAYEREKQIQGWSRAKKLALTEGRFDDLSALSRGRGPSTSSGSGIAKGARRT
jgi:putative endonuclease